MPGYMLHAQTVMQCTHVAPATTVPGQARVLVSGQPVAVSLGMITVAGCPFQIPVVAGTKPQPCVKVQWLMFSTRVTVMGNPVLLQPEPGTGNGICQSVEQIPQGPPQVAAMQMRVMAT